MTTTADRLTAEPTGQEASISPSSIEGLPRYRTSHNGHTQGHYQDVEFRPASTDNKPPLKVDIAYDREKGLTSFRVFGENVTSGVRVMVVLGGEHLVSKQYKITGNDGLVIGPLEPGRIVADGYNHVTFRFTGDAMPLSEVLIILES